MLEFNGLTLAKVHDLPSTNPLNLWTLTKKVVDLQTK
jgi:hypothetical protein